MSRSTLTNPKQARSKVGDDLHLGGWSGDGFSKAIQWFPSLEEALMSLLIDPFKFKKLIEYFDELCIAWSQAQVQLGNLESIQISSPYAGSSFISPKMYKEMVLPSVTKLSKSIDEVGGISYIHTCGSIGDRLELLAESGTQGIECMDPPPLGNVSLFEAKNRIGNKIFLKGNIDSVNVLLQADEDTMKKTVDRDHKFRKAMWLEKRKRPLPVWLPGHAIEPLRRWMEACYLFPEQYKFAIQWRPLSARSRIRLGDVKVRAFRTTHLDHTRDRLAGRYPSVGFDAHSLLIEAGGKRMVYSADLGQPEDLGPLLAQPVDFLVTELAHFHPKRLFSVPGTACSSADRRDPCRSTRPPTTHGSPTTCPKNVARARCPVRERRRCVEI